MRRIARAFELLFGYYCKIAQENLDHLLEAKVSTQLQAGAANRERCR